MKYVKLLTSGAAIIAMLFVTKASADIITPGGYAPGGTTSFGNGIAGTTFGGTGISITDVRVTQVGPVALQLSATSRGPVNPPLTNDGVGTFQATPGTDTTDSNPAHANYAKWNVDFSVNGMISGYTSKLFYDLDPTVGNDVSNFITLGGSNIQDSWNLDFNFLGGLAGFDANATGEYGFKLATYDASGGEIASSSILVDVGNVSGGGGGSNNVPDGGSTVAMLGGVLGLFGLIRRHASGLLGLFSMSSAA